MSLIASITFDNGFVTDTDTKKPSNINKRTTTAEIMKKFFFIAIIIFEVFSRLWETFCNDSPDNLFISLIAFSKTFFVDFIIFFLMAIIVSNESSISSISSCRY